MLGLATSVLKEAWFLTASMAPYLLLGFAVAGLIRAFLPMRLISRHVGGESTAAVLKASIFGIPLPLCSCGVLPVAASIRDQGAGRAPTLSFLITTPVTGIDSLLATWALLGPIFTIVRLVVSFILGVFAGLLSALLGKTNDRGDDEISCANGSCEPSEAAETSLASKLASAVRYSFVELPQDIAGSILLGLLVGGAIAALFPPELVERYIGTGILGIVVSVVMAIPLYVCATGSIPVAAAMMLKGFSPGAALAFLIAGPATNAVAITTVKKLLGTKTLAVYLATIFAGALGFGLMFDAAINAAPVDLSALLAVSHKEPGWLDILSGLALTTLLVAAWLKKALLRTATAKREDDMAGKLVLSVPSMSCSHCVHTVTSVLKSLDGVESVDVDLASKRVVIAMAEGFDAQAAIDSLKKAGYEAEPSD